MTDRQYKICKIILNQKQLKRILSKAKLSDLHALQCAMPPRSMGYMDIPVTDTTEIALDDWILEEYQDRKRDARDRTWTRILAVIGTITGITGAITGIIALLTQ